MEEIPQANNLTRTYPALPFRVFSHLLYRFAYGYNVPPGKIARTQDELVIFLGGNFFRLVGNGFRGIIIYDGNSISFMEEGNFYRSNEAETQTNGKFIAFPAISRLHHNCQRVV